MRALLGLVAACATTGLAAEPPLATQTLALEQAALERIVDGSIEAVNQATVSAQTSGRIAEILYDVNDFVPAGAVIIRLRAAEQRSGLQQAQAALQEATVREAETRTQFTRVENLFKERVVSRQQYDQALADRDAAKARLEAAKAALEAAREGVSYTEIRAPYAGIVTKRHVQVGESVQPGTALMSGLSLQYLRVNIEVPQSTVERVRAIKKAAVYVGERRVEATSLTVFPTASEGSHTFHARADLPANAADLYPGMLVKVGLVVGEAERLLVPFSALVQRSEVTAVYVVKDKAVRLRQIRIGERFGERVEVLAGLTAGEQIALDPIAAGRSAGL